MSNAYLPMQHGKDETCPLSTEGRTRRVQLVQGEGGGLEDLHQRVADLRTIARASRAGARGGASAPGAGGRGFESRTRLLTAPSRISVA